MASAFGHAVAAWAIGSGFKDYLKSPKFWILGILCAIAPDADVLTFKFGIDYDSFWGHRGFFHSFFFAGIFAALLVAIFYQKDFKSRKGLFLFIFFFICMLSHGLLDACTTGGRGIAFFAPFDNTRYFLPWKVIKVSPMSAARFFSEWGLRVLKSEAIYIGIPSLVYLLIVRLRRR